LPPVTAAAADTAAGDVLEVAVASTGHRRDTCGERHGGGLATMGLMACC